jgi:hypothetical protein
MGNIMIASFVVEVTYYVKAVLLLDGGAWT